MTSDCNINDLGKGEKVQLSHLLLDVDFLHKPKIKALRYRYGHIAALGLIEIYCLLSRATEAVIERDVALSVCSDLGITDGEAFLDYCTEREILEVNQNGEISNDRVRADQAACARKLSQSRDRQRRKRGAIGEYSDQSGNSELTTAESELELTKDPPVTHVSRGGHAEKQRDPVNVHVNVNVLDLDLEEKDTSAAADEWLEIANEKLEDPTGSPEWTRAPAYMSAGRRPMRDYPDVWLTPHELATVCRDYEGSNIPGKMFRVAFERAQTQANTLKATNRDPSRAGACGWLLGFIKQAVLDNLIKETRLQTAKEGARRVA